jgi:RNA polymerase sigma factor (TIGR02999 family)
MVEQSGRSTTANVTALLRAWSAGDQSALDQLMPVLHGELKRIARRFMRCEREGHTLQPTALANEAWLRIVGQRDVSYQNRTHFFSLAASMIRRILVNYAPPGSREKGGAAQWSH